MATYTYDVLLGALYLAGNNCAHTALGRLMDEVEAESGRWPHWEDLAPTWVVRECGFEPSLPNELMDEALVLQRMRGASGELMDATEEQEQKFNSFAAKIEKLYDDCELAPGEFNSLATTAFYDYDLKLESCMSE